MHCTYWSAGSVAPLRSCETGCPNMKPAIKSMVCGAHHQAFASPFRTITMKQEHEQGACRMVTVVLVQRRTQNKVCHAMSCLIIPCHTPFLPTVRVNTHFAALQYNVGQWRDSCHSFAPPSYDLTKVELTKYFAFTPIAQQRYDGTKDHFIRTNHTDTHYDFNASHVVDGFLKRMLTIRETADMPCSARSGMFWLFSMFLLSWVARTHLSAKTGRYHYPIIKQLLD
eukprot:m.38933 g.38933  ORF g.38933 m.38933 type:complete len:226 (-) comp12624_c0_seq1:66-743(-)